MPALIKDLSNMACLSAQHLLATPAEDKKPLLQLTTDTDDGYVTTPKKDAKCAREILKQNEGVVLKKDRRNKNDEKRAERKAKKRENRTKHLNNNEKSQQQEEEKKNEELDADSLLSEEITSGVEDMQLFDDLRCQLQELKSDITHICKKNFELEREVQYFDQRIALLINHKITVDEFKDNISYGEYRLGALKDDLKNRSFGNLFFLLQTDPKYLAKLSRFVSISEIDELLQIVLFSLYGNQYEAREEHLLLRMFEYAIRMEFEETDDFTCVMRGNSAITRMMTRYTRRGPGQEYIKATLQELVTEVNSNLDLNLEVHPMQIYTSIYGDSESITMERALRDPQVAKVIKYRIKGLVDITTKFFDAIVDSIDYVPYGIRWLCKAIYQLTKERFPNVSEDNITNLIGGFFMLRFINVALVTPHTYMLLTAQPRPTMRRNFVLIAKLLQTISNNLPQQTLKERYMKPLQQFVNSRSGRLHKFFRELCDVDDFHSYLEIEQYLSLPKDMSINITLKEIHRLHELLCKYQDFIIDDDNDKLTVLLTELGEPSSAKIVDDVCVDITLLSRWDVTSNFKNDFMEGDGTSDRGIKNLRKQSKKLLVKLLNTAPHLMQEATIRDVISRGLSSDDEEVTRLASFAMTCVGALQDNDRHHQDETFFRDCKECVAQQEVQADRMLRELKGLKNVKDSLEWHGQFLREQLEIYKEYLHAVRNKAAIREGRSSPGKASKLSMGPFDFTYNQLEKEGVILDSRSISDKRKHNMSFSVSCTEPGIYRITLRYKTPIAGQPTIMDMDLRLEELLELQHFKDPVLTLSQSVILDVRRTLTFLHKHFTSKRL